MGDSDDSESDLNLAQQILDDLDILLPVAGDHHSDGRSSGDSSENVEAVKMSGVQVFTISASQDFMIPGF